MVTDALSQDTEVVKEEVDEIEDEMADIDLDGDDDDVVIVDVDKTMQYLSGKISFEEFTDIMEHSIVSNEGNVGGSNVALDSAISPESPSSVSADKKARRRKKLPKSLEGLMGEANMRYMRSEYDEAVKMCMEIIRMAPSAADPFHTLAMIYEDLGEREKSLQFRLVAAHLIQNDPDEWLRVAELCREQNNVAQLLVCYEKAARLEPRNREVCLERCSLLEAVNDVKKMLEGYRHYLEILPIEDSGEYMKLAREIIQKYNDRNELDKVLETMLAMFKKHPELVNDADVNSLLEMYISKGLYTKALVILVKHSGVLLCDETDAVVVGEWIDVDSTEFLKSVSVARCVLTRPLPIDLRAKLVVCLIRLKLTPSARELMLPLLSENPDEIGDLYLDIAEAYMSQGHYCDARPLLETLVQSSEYNKAGVWLRYGECLNALCELETAIVAYENVVEKAPCHYEARVSLSALFQQLGRQDEALRALSVGELPTESSDRTLDVRLTILSCQLLHSQGRYDEFVESAKRVIFSFSKDIIDTRKQHNALPHTRMWKSRLGALQYASSIPLDPAIKPVDAALHKSPATTEDLWDIYLKLCRILIDRREFDEFETVSIMALICPLFLYNQAKALETEFICLSACVMSRNGQFAYAFIREHCVKNLDSNRAWNTFCQIVTVSADQRHNKFCLRLAMKQPHNHALGILNGHNALVAGSYKHALGEYVAALRKTPDDPLLHLLIGITFVHMAAQKFPTKRHVLTIQGCAFLNQYLELRGECQEAYFNIGRAMHQLGLFSTAVVYYNKALTYSAAISEDDEGGFDLTKEIAFNLNLIYINSGSFELASHISQKYLVI